MLLAEGQFVGFQSFLPTIGMDNNTIFPIPHADGL